MAVKKNDRGLQHLLNGRDSRIDNLPGQQVLPVLGNDGHDVPNIVGVVVPVLLRRMAKLVDQDRSAALRQEKQREGRRHQVVFLTASSPESGQWILFPDDLFGTQAIPVVLSEETHG